MPCHDHPNGGFHTALRSTLVTQKPQILEIDLTDDLGTKGGDVCGGKLWVFIEPL